MKYGHLTESAIGIILKEAVRRAIQSILLERQVFRASQKATSYNGSDWVTTADRRAQEIYLNIIKECLPGFGVAAEEDELSIKCTLPNINAYLTVDPLDGTNAFIRRQSWGIGTMVALVTDDEVVSAYVGEVMSQEIYGFRPGSPKVHRISQYNTAEELRADQSKPLSKQYCLLIEQPRKHSTLVRRLAGVDANTHLFAGVEVNGGSIGTAMARLWKGEVGGVVLPPYPLTPWDFAPILGISEQLGFVFLRLNPQAQVFENFNPKPSARVQAQPDELLVIHPGRLGELNEWLGRHS
jgi:fructose-1,6-bisphosphatase/inositol monophosphatase family enzyme